MHPTILAITKELSCQVPSELMGTRAAIFFLMKDRIEAPQSVHARIGASFGRIMQSRVVPPQPAQLRPLGAAAAPAPQSDDFVFSAMSGAVPRFA